MTGALGVFLAVAATVLLVAGALALYATTRHQALLPNPAPQTVGRAGWLLVSAALIGFLNVAGPATAVFIWMTALMFVWSLAPVIAKWLRWKKEGAR
jgi:hypothetical protein